MVVAPDCFRVATKAAAVPFGVDSFGTVVAVVDIVVVAAAAAAVNLTRRVVAATTPGAVLWRGDAVASNFPAREEDLAGGVACHSSWPVEDGSCDYDSLRQWWTLWVRVPFLIAAAAVAVVVSSSFWRDCCSRWSTWDYRGRPLRDCDARGIRGFAWFRCRPRRRQFWT